MKLRFQTFFLTSIAGLFFLINVGCTHSSLLKRAFIINGSVLEKRALQTQRFQNLSKKDLISAIVAVMQDLSFSFDEGNNDLGLFIGSKRRSFTRYLPVTRTEQRFQTQTQVINGQVVSRPVLVNVPVTVFEPFVFITETRIAIIIYPLFQNKDEAQKDFLVRANLQQMTWNESTGGITEADPFGGPDFYKDFFSKLSKSVFLEKNL